MADEMNSQSLVEQYSESVRQRQLEAEAQMQKLIDALNVRKSMPFDPVLMRISGALLSPTKTGSVGESLGYAATAAADEAQRQAAQGFDLAKLEFELGQKKREQQAGLEQQKFRMQYLSQPRGQAPTLAQPPAEPLTAMPPVEAQDLSAVPQMSTPEAPAVLPAEMPKAPAGALQPAAPSGTYVPRPIDPMLSVVDPQLFEYEMKMREVERKDAELIAKQKEADARAREQELKENSVNVFGLSVPMTKDERQSMNAAIQNKDLKTLERIFLPKGSQSPFVLKDNQVAVMPAEDWKRKQKAAEELGEIKRTIGKKTYEMTGPEAIAHDEAKRIGGKTYRDWVDNYFQQRESGTAGPQAEPVMSVEERMAEQKRREKKALDIGEAEAKTRAEIISNAKNAIIIEKPAGRIFKMGSDPIQQKALGIIEDGTLADAVFGVVSEGGSIGPIKVGLPAIREAIAKVSGDPKERKQILDALQMLRRDYAEIELMYAQTYLAKQGQVTEGERAIVRQVSGGVHNRVTVALAQAEMMMQRAAFDKEIKSEYLRWEKANPDKSIDDFSESKGYKSLVSNLDQNMDKIYDKYFGSAPRGGAQAAPEAAPKASASTTPSSGGSIRAQIDAEKKARGLK